MAIILDSIYPDDKKFLAVLSAVLTSNESKGLLNAGIY